MPAIFLSIQSHPLIQNKFTSPPNSIKVGPNHAVMAEYWQSRKQLPGNSVVAKFLFDFLFVNGNARPVGGVEDEEDLRSSCIFMDRDSLRVIDVLLRCEGDDDLDPNWDPDSQPNFSNFSWTTEQYEAWLRDNDSNEVMWHRAFTTARILRGVIDELPPDVTAVDISDAGKVLWLSTDVELDTAEAGSYFPSLHEYQLARPFKTFFRPQLTEVQRLGRMVTRVTCTGDTEQGTAVYKCAAHNGGTYGGGVWSEIQVLSRLPPHPHILGLDAIVLEELTGQGIVGFLTRFVSGVQTLNMPQPPGFVFKLRHLRELMAVVDTLNLQYGISHQDIAGDNLFVDPATDSILVFDFGLAASIPGTRPPGSGRQGGGENDHGGGGNTASNDVYPYRGYSPSCSDVKGVLFFLYSFITRDPNYEVAVPRYMSSEPLEARAKWVLHPEVRLDKPVDAFFDALMAWVHEWRDKRGLQFNMNAETGRQPDPTGNYHLADGFRPMPAPRCLDLPDPLPCEIDGVRVNSAHHENIGLFDVTRKARRKAGLPVLNWERPPKAKVDPARRLLVTGRYADEEPDWEVARLPVLDKKKGFPQSLSTPWTPPLDGVEGGVLGHDSPRLDDRADDGAGRNTGNQDDGKGLGYREGVNGTNKMHKRAEVLDENRSDKPKGRTRRQRRDAISRVSWG